MIDVLAIVLGLIVATPVVLWVLYVSAHLIGHGFTKGKNSANEEKSNGEER